MMATKKDSIIKMKSSEMLFNFLENTNLHKKDFAQMIGVTLSYVYNLIDETIPFSTRSTTLERIATVMDISPDEFVEYKIPQDPILIDDTTQFLKEKQKELKMSTVQLLKSFPRKQRLEIVDILRGARPIPLDWVAVTTIGEVLNISNEEMYDYWEARFKQVLINAGFNFESNSELAKTMFNCCRDFVYKQEKKSKP